jgi:hypothetical protein
LVSRIDRFAAFAGIFFAGIFFFKDFFSCRLSATRRAAWDRFPGFAAFATALGTFLVTGFTSGRFAPFAESRFLSGRFAPFAESRFASGRFAAAALGILFPAPLLSFTGFAASSAAFRPFAGSDRPWAFFAPFAGDSFAAAARIRGPWAFPGGVFFRDTGLLTGFLVAIDGWQTGYNWLKVLHLTVERLEPRSKGKVRDA